MGDVRIPLDDDLHSRAKAQAALAKMLLKDYLTQAISERVDRDEQGIGERRPMRIQYDYELKMPGSDTTMHGRVDESIEEERNDESRD